MSDTERKLDVQALIDAATLLAPKLTQHQRMMLAVLTKLGYCPSGYPYRAEDWETGERLLRARNMSMTFVEAGRFNHPDSAWITHLCYVKENGATTLLYLTDGCPYENDCVVKSKAEHEARMTEFGWRRGPLTLSNDDYEAFKKAVDGDDPPEQEMIDAADSVRHLFE